MSHLHAETSRTVPYHLGAQTPALTAQPYAASFLNASAVTAVVVKSRRHFGRASRMSIFCLLPVNAMPSDHIGRQLQANHTSKNPVSGALEP
jgi:hypothetical protein